MTITYSKDTKVKEYKIGASGTWTQDTTAGNIATVTTVTMTTNDTIFARWIDTTGNFSNEAKYVVNNIVYNVALKKNATQSSNYSTAYANKLVDGNADGKWASGSVSCTGLDTNPWWQVDLGDKYYIPVVKIWNRAEAPSRLSNFWVFASEKPFSTNDLNTLKADSSIWKVKQTSYPNLMMALQVNAVGRYIRVQIEGTQYLQMAEVEVFTNGKAIP